MQICRYAFVASLACVGGVRAIAQELPELVCQTLEEVTIVHIDSLPTRHTKTPDLYRIAGGKLFMSSLGGDEYLYGDLKTADWLRFTSGYKTIIFSSEKYDVAVEVHTDSQSTRIRRLHCSSARTAD